MTANTNKFCKLNINFDTSGLSPLIDVTDILQPEQVFSLEEHTELVDTACHLIYEHIINNVLSISCPKFYDNIYDEIIDLLLDQLSNTHNYNIEDELHQILNEAFHIIFTTLVPRRSYKKTFIRKKIFNLTTIQNKILHIKSKPQPAQRTQEWYEFRNNTLTASSAWKAFGSQSIVNQLIYEKCKPMDISKYSRFNTSSPLHHGQKYEPVSVAYYEYTYNLKVDEFGCILHDIYPFIAASPDGIVVTPDNPRFGRMLEIKNIVNRKITGIPKEEYWIQMQLQMETCNLNECDFLETRFCEYETEEEFNNDGTFNKSADGKQKGVIIYYIVDGNPYYEYSPYNCSIEEFREWEHDMMIKHKDHTWNHNIYWKMDEVSCVLVLRNKLWFKEAVKVLENVWNIICYERINGYEHRAPAVRPKQKLVTSTSNNLIVKKLGNDDIEMIDVDDIENSDINNKPICLLDLEYVNDKIDNSATSFDNETKIIDDKTCINSNNIMKNSKNKKIELLFNFENDI